MTAALPYLLLFALSLAVLVKASDWFVGAAERIGLSLGISPFVVGVTIVAFGTSLPELAASVAAVLRGESAIVVNTVVGSNVANILLVMGLVAAFTRRVDLQLRVVDLEIPLLLAAAFLLAFMLRDQWVSTAEAIILLVGLLVFLVHSFRSEADPDPDAPPAPRARPRDYGMLVLGGVLVYFGADYTVRAIQTLSDMAGIDAGLIAVTLVAVGTSLPEIVVSIAAARKGNTGMVVGNVIGSNIFNTYAVVGIPALLGPLEVSADLLAFRLPFMVAATLLFAFICVSNRIGRWEGLMLLLFYAYFVVDLVAATAAG